MVIHISLTGGYLAIGNLHHLLWHIQEKYYDWWEYPAKKVMILLFSLIYSKFHNHFLFYWSQGSPVENIDFVHSRKRTLNTCLLDIMSHDCNEITFSWMNEWSMNKWVRLLLSSCKMAFQRNVYARYARAHYLYFFRCLLILPCLII